MTIPDEIPYFETRYWYSFREFIKIFRKHPELTKEEIRRFMDRQLYGKLELPVAGLRFEQHSHSSFSDGDDLSDLIDFLFGNGTDIWSLTDHNNSCAFDSLRKGSYRLGKKYELEFSDDNRSMVIHSGDRQLVLLRSVEVSTDKGHIGVHGYDGFFNEDNLQDTMKKARDTGGYAIVNHPYSWHGAGKYGMMDFCLENGAVAIEKSGAEIGPLLHSPVRAELDAARFNVPIVASEDAHRLNMYGLSGLIFDEQEYSNLLTEKGNNHADVVKGLVSSGRFENHFNYLTLQEFRGFYKAESLHLCLHI